MEIDAVKFQIKERYKLVEWLVGLMQAEAKKGKCQLFITEKVWNDPSRPRIVVDPHAELEANADPEMLFQQQMNYP